MRRRLLSAALFTVALASCTMNVGSTDDDLPAFTAPVVDAVGALSDDVVQSVSTQLQSFRDAGGPQIAVAVVNTTGNKSIEDYSIDLAREWGVGDKTRDDGVVILIALDDRTMRIEVGSGVEGDLTDVTASRIVNDVMIPLLRNDDVDGAVQQGAAAVQQVWKGEGVPSPVVPPDSTTTSSTDWVGSLFFIMFLIFFVALPIMMRATGVGRGRGWGGAVFIPGAFGGSHGGRGGGFGGGGFGGGFGGGGGGGFSGGGSSGSW